MEYKKFKSPKGEIIVNSLHGHSVRLNVDEWSDVPDLVWSEVYAAGGISEDMLVTNVINFVEEKRLEAVAKEEEDRQRIKTKMKTILEEPVTYLDSKNKLIQRKVVALLNQPIKRDLMDSIWDEIISEMKD